MYGPTEREFFGMLAVVATIGSAVGAALYWLIGHIDVSLTVRWLP